MNMIVKPRYKNLFLYSSLQFTGNIEEYFSKHTKKLVAFVVNPRLKNKDNFIRLYNNGKLISKKKVYLSENIFLYYFLLQMTHISILMTYFSRKEKVAVITFHPLTFFAMNLQSIFRNITFVYWVGDYFPPVSFSLRLFEKLKRFYNNRVKYACYLSDEINKKMNGKILRTNERKTVMWSIMPKNIHRTSSSHHFIMLFVGVIKKNQGLEYIFEFLKTHKDYEIKIIGNCEDKLYGMIMKTIEENEIEDRVYFPNKFFLNSELEYLSKACHVGIALYDTSKDGATFYTDPGKVKTYAQLGLPIIMSNIPTVAKYVKKFNCGEIIDDNGEELGNALIKIKNNYNVYLEGLKKFNSYFDAEIYYKKAFSFLETI